eukprot:7726090-Prorocentrum_lima.AAC.1
MAGSRFDIANGPGLRERWEGQVLARSSYRLIRLMTTIQLLARGADIPEQVTISNLTTNYYEYFDFVVTEKR